MPFPSPAGDGKGIQITSRGSTPLPQVPKNGDLRRLIRCQGRIPVTLSLCKGLGSSSEGVFPSTVSEGVFQPANPHLCPAFRRYSSSSSLFTLYDFESTEIIQHLYPFRKSLSRRCAILQSLLEYAVTYRMFPGRLITWPSKP